MVSMCIYRYIHTLHVVYVPYLCYYIYVLLIYDMLFIYIYICDSCILLICVTCICCLYIYIYIHLLWICTCIYTFKICIHIYIHLNIILTPNMMRHFLYQRLQVDVNKWVCLNMCCTSQNKTGCLFADQSYDIETHFASPAWWIEVIGRFITRLIGALVTMFTCLPSKYGISWSLWNQLRWWLQRDFSLQVGHS
jgi:hypothetical protein